MPSNQAKETGSKSDDNAAGFFVSVVAMSFHEIRAWHK